MNQKSFISKVILVVLAIVMLVNANARAEANIKTTLSLEEAVEVGIKNSPLIELNQINLEKLRVELSEARSQERKYNKDKDNPFTLMGAAVSGTQEGFMLEEEAATKGKQYEIDEANMKEDFIKKSLESGITKAYYGVLQTKDGLDVQKSTLDNLQRNHDIVKKQLEVGTASKSELYMAEIALNEGKVNLAKAENTYKETLRILNNALNYPLDTQLELTSAYKENDANIDLKKDLNKAFENRYDLIVSKNTKELADLQFTVTKRSYTPNTYKYKYAESNIKSLENLLDNKKKEIEADIKGKYDAIKTAKEEIRLMNANIEKASEGLRLAKLQYELGTGTSLKVKEAIVMLNQAELGKANAVASYNTSLIDYDRAVNIGDM